VPEAGRVITGSAGGLRLDAPGAGTRPLSDRVKQALFSLIEAERPDVWEQPFLDLYAGSGAAGIEALSRGATLAMFVERDARAIAVIERNLARTGLAQRARVVRRDVAAFLAAGPAAAALREVARPATGVPREVAVPAAGATPSPAAASPFGCVFLDPPYAEAAQLLAALRALAIAGTGWLDEPAVVVAKHFWKTPPPERVGSLTRARERRFGETALSVYRLASESAAGGS
jgi:16S rRNA G966 N2-methylase RsmD